MDLQAGNIVPVHGLNYKDKPDDARNWLDELGDPYTRTGADLNGRVGIDLGVYGVPETFVIDKAGRIAHKHIGALDQEALDKTILPLIARLRGTRTMPGDRRNWGSRDGLPRRDRVVPVAMRAAAGAGLCLLRGRAFPQRLEARARDAPPPGRARPQRCLRPRLFQRVRESRRASASAIGSLFQAYRFEASYVAGAVIILFGLHMTGLLRFPG